MKRILFFFLTLTAFAACSPKTAKINPVVPVSDGYTIKAPTLRGGTVLSWKKGERVLICDSKGNTYILTASADGNSVVFTGNVPDNLGSFKALYPGKFAGEKLANIEDGIVYCNVYLWDNKWAVPEVWVNGSKVATMTKAKVTTDAMNDPLYTHFYNIWKAEGKMAQRDEPGKDYDNMHIFKYTPVTSVKSVEVRVQDRWGESHTQSISW